MDRIETLIAQNDYKALLKQCEDLELELATFENPAIVRIYSLQLITLLILNELTAAKLLWKRVPSGYKDGEIAHIWAIGKGLWKRDFAAVYTALNRSWSADVAVLINHLQSSIRARAFELLSKSYSSISVTDLSTTIGLSASEATEFATKNGWTLEGDYFTIPLSTSTPTKESVKPTQLTQLAAYIMHLEK